MSGEPAIIRVLRESVEAEVAGSVASASLFAALARFGSRIPTTFVEVVELVDGPLRDELRTRLGDEPAARICRALEARLRLAEMPTGTVSAVPRAFEEASTNTVTRAPGPVPIRVLAATRTMEMLILASLGPGRARVSVAPELLIIDGSDAPESWGTDLEEVALDAGAAIVYGTDLPSGEHAAARLRGAEVELFAFDCEHGVAPILDLIRARAG